MLGRPAPKAAALESDDPELPYELEYLWRWFENISLGLSATGMGLPSVTWEALLAWCVMKRESLAPWEADTLVILGALRVSIHAKANKNKAPAPPPAPPKQSRKR